MPESLRAFLEQVPEELAPPEPGSPRERILSAARALFAERGFSRAGIRAIAAVAAVNPAMIHYYYGNKGLLHRRVIAQELRATIRGIFERLEPGLPPAEVLVRIPIGIMREMRGNPERLGLLRREIADGGEQVRRAIVEMGPHGPLGLRDLISSLIRGAQARGEVRPLPVEAILPFLVAVGHGSMIMEPFFQLVLGIEAADETSWSRRLESFEVLLRQGLAV
ncbi:MAG: TetR family transcriptional regulator [Candidatus Eisenbacteria bacterium]